MTAARWAQLGAKLAVPLAGVGVLLVAVLIPPAHAGQPTSAQHRPPRAVPLDAKDLVCPGPETVGVRGAAPSVAPAPAQVFGAAPPVGLRPQAGVAAGAGTGTMKVMAGRRPLSSASTGSDLSARVKGLVTADVPPVIQARGAAAPGAVAEQVTVVTTGDLRGLSSAICTEPSDDIWLVGGGSDPGRRGRLVLTNPRESTAQVSVDVLGDSGPVARTPGSTVAIPPRSRTVLLLDALAPGVKSPVVHVRSSGGSVSAVLNDSWLEGTTPRGSDDVVASMPPTRTVLVPGLRIQGAAMLRIAVPGGDEAVAQVRLVGEKGDVDLPDDGVVRIPAGSSHDLDLSAVPAGAYAVQVVADEPVVAGAMVRTAQTAAGGDLAWSASSGPVTSLSGVPQVWQVPGLWRTDLLLTAPERSGSMDVVSVAADGSTTTTTVDVTAGSTRVVPLVGVGAWLRPRPGTGPLVVAEELAVKRPDGLLITSSPVRDSESSRVPADIAAAAD